MNRRVSDTGQPAVGRSTLNIINGVTDGTGSYCYIIYVRPEDYERAAESLGV